MKTRRLRILGAHLGVGSTDLVVPRSSCVECLHCGGHVNHHTDGSTSFMPCELRTFCTDEVFSAACWSFFQRYGFAVINDALGAKEVAFLNNWYDRSQCSHAEAWGCERGSQHEWLYHQPLLDFPELDPFVRHPSHYGIVAKLLGGETQTRFSEFDFRETPAGTGGGVSPGNDGVFSETVRSQWHADNGFGGASDPDAVANRDHDSHDYICAMHYLSDVTPRSPAFGVIPYSHRFVPQQPAAPGNNSVTVQLAAHLGEGYREIPLYGAAGTCIIYDISLYHSRIDATEEPRCNRRALQTYYSSANAAALTDWVLVPERLVASSDFMTRRFYSLQGKMPLQQEYAARGFTDMGCTKEQRQKLRLCY
jgi:hypothetical protein